MTANTAEDTSSFSSSEDLAAGPSTSLSADGLYVDPSETSTAAPNPEVQRRFDETDQGASLTSVCDLVYAHVGEGTKQKIWNGEFVELGP